MTTDTLSRMEWLVWCCWAGGMTLRQTAYSLGLGLETVRTYRRRTTAKLGPRPHLTERSIAHA